MSDKDLVPVLLADLPEPSSLRRVLLDQVESAYAALRAARGPVTVPEDTFDAQRRLVQARELFAGYSDAFRKARTRIAQILEEELVEAVGEQDGRPNQGLTVPDASGDIRVSLDMARVHDIDTDALVSWVAASYTQRLTELISASLGSLGPAYPPADGGEWATSSYAGDVYTEVQGALFALLGLGSFTPQVSKVRALAETLARNGHDSDAAVVRGTIVTRSTYQGLKVERKSP